MMFFLKDFYLNSRTFDFLVFHLPRCFSFVYYVYFLYFPRLIFELSLVAFPRLGLLSTINRLYIAIQDQSMYCIVINTTA